jgi:hypothetical protein
MSLTPHHAKHFAHDLTRRATSGMDRVSMALFDTAVALNPHQGYSAKDSEFDLVYVNGDTWKVRLIEEDFHRLMLDAEGA